MSNSKALALALPALCSATLSIAATPSNDGQSHKHLKDRWVESRPQWGLQLKASSSNLGDRTFNYRGNPSHSHSFGIDAEFQPSFLQFIGVLGIGPSFVTYSNPGSARAAKDLVLATGFGAQARYQAKLFRHQWLVPTVSYRAEQLRFRLQDDTRGSTLAKSYGAGLWLSLSELAHLEGQKFFASYGVSRVYITSEMSIPHQTRGELDQTGKHVHFGLRVEL